MKTIFALALSLFTLAGFSQQKHPRAEIKTLNVKALMIGASKLDVYFHMKEQTQFVDRSAEVEWSQEGIDEMYQAKFSKLAYWNAESREYVVFLFCDNKMYLKSVNFVYTAEELKYLDATMAKLNNALQKNQRFIQLAGHTIEPVQIDEEDYSGESYTPVKENQNYFEIKLGKKILFSTPGDANSEPGFFVANIEQLDLAPVKLSYDKGYPYFYLLNFEATPEAKPDEAHNEEIEAQQDSTMSEMPEETMEEMAPKEKVEEEEELEMQEEEEEEEEEEK